MGVHMHGDGAENRPLQLLFERKIMGKRTRNCGQASTRRRCQHPSRRWKPVLYLCSAAGTGRTEVERGQDREVTMMQGHSRMHTTTSGSQTENKTNKTKQTKHDNCDVQGTQKQQGKRGQHTSWLTMGRNFFWENTPPLYASSSGVASMPAAMGPRA